MTLPCQKEFFEIPEDIIYLNCSYLSPLFSAVKEAGVKGIMRKSQPWEIKPHDFFEQSKEVKQLFAKVTNTSAQNIAIIPSVSYGIGIAAKNLRVSMQQNIIILEEQFPSNVYPWKELAKKNSAQVITVARPQNHDWTQAILDTINKDTAVVALSHCHWTDGSIIDLKIIGKVCRDKNIPLVIDATQSLGILDINIKDVQPAFVIAAGYKWLLGPYSLAFMYVAPEYHDCSPLENNWMNRKGSENFAQLVDYTNEYAIGAQRFDMGERSNFILLPMAIAALEQILKWGIENIQSNVESLVNRIIHFVEKFDLPEKHGFEILPQNLRCSHILGLRFENSLPADFGKKMVERKVYVSIRSNVIRISPYIYNNELDCERFANVLSEI
ncbi:aminotransferase class V-fold PLP-dependent enzyme [Candidatus Uabimicrobium sp. HlEnr_7]|uniref:aminotransferase class V-fold PLP-dependent enzyme n=1 Tax=Candidatus Uabimicrobium helgolandensis TaxID=3095367 RepID=UPI003557E367